MSESVSSDSFESWLLRRVTEVTEAGEVSGDLLRELQGELGVSVAHHPACGHAMALRSLVDLLWTNPASAEDNLSGSPAHRGTTREQLLRDIAEIWLAEQRKAYWRHQNSPACFSDSEGSDGRW